MNETAARFSLILGGPLDRRPGHARRWAMARCAQAGVESATSSVPLLVSELVTNACVHGGDPMALRLDLNGSRMRIEMEDSASDWPAVQSPTDRDPGGRGLLIVDSLSQAWGVDRVEAGGKIVWAEVEIEKPGDEVREMVGSL